MITFSKQTTSLRRSSFLLLSYWKASLPPGHKPIPEDGFPPSISSLPKSKPPCPPGHLSHWDLGVEFISTVWSPRKSQSHQPSKSFSYFCFSRRPWPPHVSWSLVVAVPPSTAPLSVTCSWVARWDKSLIMLHLRWIKIKKLCQQLKVTIGHVYTGHIYLFELIGLLCC